MSAPLPEILNSEVVYRGYFNLRVDQVKYPRGDERDYTVLLTGPEAAVILAETDEGKFIINREYRHPTGQWILGCPGGRIDPGESPLDAAIRELREETGYTADEWIPLSTAFPFPAISDQKLHFVFAKNAKATHNTTHEPSELIETHQKTHAEILEEIARGTPIDGILCTALYLRNLLYRNEFKNLNFGNVDAINLDQAKPAPKQRLSKDKCDAGGFTVRDVDDAKD